MIAELSCPICSAEIGLAGDERKGDEVYCTYCGSPFRLTADPKQPECQLEDEDW